VILIYAATDTSASQGSGFIVHPNGIAISNYHVFEGTLKGKEQIKTQNGEIYSISEVIHKSKEGDFIIFKLSNPNDQIFPFLSVSYELPQVGEECFAIGNPQGLENTLSRGIISQIRGNGNLIQTTTEITHGSSGGPLFNMDGKVIGITTAGYEQANLNFAVSILLLREHLNFN
jgi:serine protease Do